MSILDNSGRNILLSQDNCFKGAHWPKLLNLVSWSCEEWIEQFSQSGVWKLDSEVVFTEPKGNVRMSMIYCGGDFTRLRILKMIYCERHAQPREQWILPLKTDGQRYGIILIYGQWFVWKLNYLGRRQWENLWPVDLGERYANAHKTATSARREVISITSVIKQVR